MRPLQLSIDPGCGDDAVVVPEDPAAGDVARARLAIERVVRPLSRSLAL